MNMEGAGAGAWLAERALLPRVNGAGELLNMGADGRAESSSDTPPAAAKREARDRWGGADELQHQRHNMGG